MGKYGSEISEITHLGSAQNCDEKGAVAHVDAETIQTGSLVTHCFK